MKMKRTKKPNNYLPQHYHDYPTDGDHRWWERRASGAKNPTRGRPPKFIDPRELWQACCEYFEWVDSHPLSDLKAYTYKGQIKSVNVPKMRPYTLTGLCLYLNLTLEGWRYYRKSKKEFLGVSERAEMVIYCQKFEGAAVGFFNANIIARDLGLNEVVEISDPRRRPRQTESTQKIDVSQLSDEELLIITRALDRIKLPQEAD